MSNEPDTIDRGTFELVTSIMSASAEANFKTMDTLYEIERRRRMALEVLIGDVLLNLGDAYMGSAREYERAVEPLRWGVAGREKELAARHRENDSL